MSYSKSSEVLCPLHLSQNIFKNTDIKMNGFQKQQQQTFHTVAALLLLQSAFFQFL
jgi:hypothetical protein